MRRHLVALSFAVVTLLAAGRATGDDWKWDPKQKRTPKAGEKSTDDVVEHRKMVTKVSSGGQVLQNMNEEATTTYKSTTEIVAVEGTKVSEKVVKFDSWKLEKKGEDADTSLEGHTVRVKGVGDKRKATIEDDKDDKVSDEAKQWVESELGKKQKKKADEEGKEEEDEMKNFFPTAPVADGAEWKPDIEAIAKEVGLECDATKSTAKGSLTKVHVVDGVHMGHLEIKVSLATTPEGVTWKEGGTFDITISLDTSLDADKPETSDGSFDVKFGGKGEADSPQGKLNVKQQVEQKRTGKTTPVK